MDCQWPNQWWLYHWFKRPPQIFLKHSIAPWESYWVGHGFSIPGWAVCSERDQGDYWLVAPTPSWVLRITKQILKNVNKSGFLMNMMNKNFAEQKLGNFISKSHWLLPHRWKITMRITIPHFMGEQTWAQGTVSKKTKWARGTCSAQLCCCVCAHVFSDC